MNAVVNCFVYLIAKWKSHCLADLSENRIPIADKLVSFFHY